MKVIINCFVAIQTLKLHFYLFLYEEDYMKYKHLNQRCNCVWI